MAVRLNLLHEVQQEELARRKDPVKFGLLAMVVLLATMALFYVVRASQFNVLRNRANQLTAEWAAKEPAMVQAKEKEAQHRAVIAKAGAIRSFTEDRFYWAPLMEQLLKSLPREVSISSLRGRQDQASGLVGIEMEGMAAGAEPRKVAEGARRSLQSRLESVYKDTEVSFSTLEDETQRVNLDGQSQPAVRFSIKAQFNFEPKKLKMEARRDAQAQ